jgi:hypothetical protein
MLRKLNVCADCFNIGVFLILVNNRFVKSTARGHKKGPRTLRSVDQPIYREEETR